jgi:hypothetical protein
MDTELNQKIMTLIYRQKNKVVFFIIALLCLSIFRYEAQAQNAVSLSVSPAIFEMNARPGQTWESKLRIINNNPFELTVYAETVNFRPAGEDGSPRFIPIVESDADSTLAEWIAVPNTALVIQAEQTLEIPIQIKLPDDTPPGGHYAAVLVGTRPPEDRRDATRVETSQIVSSLIFLRVAGEIVESGSIRSFRAVDNVVEKPQVDFELRFENNGNVHLRPEGEIRIYNMWGQERGVIPVNQTTLFGNILRESIRTFRFSWEGEWSPADIGRYTAEATLVYGEDGRKFTDSVATFWIIPWRILLGIVLTLVTIAVVIAWLVKLYVRRMFMMAGLEEHNLLQKQLATEKRRQISVVAPIEAGILDLRSRFSNHDESRLNVLLKFILEYKLFFIGLLILTIILYLFSWFFVTVSEDDRAFEVTITGSGQNVIVDSESLQYQQQQTEASVTKRDVPPLTLVNRSGINGAAAEVALALEEIGYTIDSVATDLNVTQEQTVIIHDPSLASVALDLSANLDNALLSPFTTPPQEKVTITVYVGTDLAN